MCPRPGPKSWHPLANLQHHLSLADKIVRPPWESCAWPLRETSTGNFARGAQCRNTLVILVTLVYDNVVSLSRAPTHDGTSRYDGVFCVTRCIGSVWFMGDV